MTSLSFDGYCPIVLPQPKRIRHSTIYLPQGGLVLGQGHIPAFASKIIR